MDRLGLRAITMQQPYAAAMVAGEGLYTRRGKSTSFASGGEWVAIHCGQNSEHLNNATVMKAIRARWPACPSDAELRAQQRCLLGAARFVDGCVDAKAASKGDFFLANYDCAKPVAWRADGARACPRPLPYPKGQLQVWHLARGGFADAADAAAIVALAKGGTGGGAVKVKQEEGAAGPKAAPASSPAKKGKRAAAEAGVAVKEEKKPRRR